MRRADFLRNTGKMNMLSKIPLVELAGDQRVLIENHLGVLSYSLVEIQVKVAYGKLSLSGSDLKIMQLGREQMVIMGRIDTIQLCRR